MDQFFSRIRILTRNSDMAIAIGLFLIVAVMIVPIPPILLDFLSLDYALIFRRCSFDLCLYEEASRLLDFPNDSSRIHDV